MELANCYVTVTDEPEQILRAYYINRYRCRYRYIDICVYMCIIYIINNIHLYYNNINSNILEGKKNKIPQQNMKGFFIFKNICSS